MRLVKNKIPLALISTPFGDNYIPTEENLQFPQEIIMVQRQTGRSLITQYLETPNLKKIKYLKLDLNEKMNESSFELLFTLFSQLSSLETLELILKNNLVSDNAAKLVSLGLSRMRKIKSLQLFAENCWITYEGITLITQQISRLAQLSELIWKLTDNKIASSSAEAYLNRSFINTFFLNLDCSLIEKGFKGLSVSLSFLQRMTKLTLTSQNENAGSREIEVLAQSIAEQTNLKFFRWSFMQSKLSQIETALIFSSVSLLTNLQYIELSFCLSKINKVELLTLVKKLRLFKQLIFISFQFLFSEFDSDFLILIKHLCIKNSQRLTQLVIKI